MKELRMPKGWTHVMTNATEFGPEESKVSKMKRLAKFQNLIRNTKTVSLSALIIEGLEEFEKNPRKNKKVPVKVVK